MFVAEAQPACGVALAVRPGIVRVVAPNPGPMTYHGTNTYVVTTPDGAVVIDPGPEDETHLDSVMRAADGKVRQILLTHRHADHAAGTERLVSLSGAPVAAAASRRADPYVPHPDQPLRDTSSVAGLVAIATPGHAVDHLCFQMGDVVFCGDHIMAWAASAILMPDGSADDYLASLHRVAALNAKWLLPGHGPAIRGIKRHVDFLIARANERDRSTLALLEAGPSTLDQMVVRRHGELGDLTREVALRSTAAILHKLRRAGRAAEENGVWRAMQ